MIINLKIVRVNSEYCDYLRKYDNKVAYNKNEKELRPFIGILFKTRTGLSSTAEAITAMVRMQACSISITTMVIAMAVFRSVRSWSHFDTTKNSKEEFFS